MINHFDLTGLAIVVVAAVLCGIVMLRLRQPAIVGYILAGILLGPSALGLVENREQITVLAELGVLMLLFLIGMELSLDAFKSVWRKALVAAILQIFISVGATLTLSLIFGWSLGLAVLLGFVIALSSTAVVIKIIEGMNLIKTPIGRIIIGVLIAQDLAFIPMMLILANLATDGVDLAGLAKIILSVGLLIAIVGYLGRREKVELPFAKMVAGHTDFTPLRGLALCFGSATVTGLLGLSPAYGAFLAGLVIGNSTERKAMKHGIKPIESILMMVFFLSIGLLIDLSYVWTHLGTVLLILFMVTIFKSLMNIGILRLTGEPWTHAFIAGILLAQIGEFSFLLGQTGVASGLISRADGDLVITVAALSIVITPLWLITARRILRFVILGATSGREVIRLLFGRHAPQVFAFTDRLGEMAERWLPKFLRQWLARSPLFKDEDGDEADGEKIVDVDWEEVTPDGKELKKKGKDA